MKLLIPFFLFLSACCSGERFAMQTNLNNLAKMNEELEVYYAEDSRFIEFEKEHGRVHPVLESRRTRNAAAIDLGEQMLEAAAAEEFNAHQDRMDERKREAKEDHAP
ncbi:MAG: hypothetical protein Q8O94_02810 [bacterium]|nr:hypothetical protein [bacterium]